MSSTQAIASALRELADGSERREHERTVVSLYGQIHLQGRYPAQCTIVDLSPGGACVETSARPKLGEKVVLDVGCIGRVLGVVVREDPFDFGIKFTVCEDSRSRLASQIALQFNRGRLRLDDRRCAERDAEPCGADLVEFADGTSEKARIKDVSIAGVAFLSESRPPLGLGVQVGVMTGRVIRHFEDGYAVSFDPPKTLV